jgi:transcriptional regulator with XRE-family HTH domain
METLKRLRERNGHEAQKMAELCGISTASLRRYESGERVPEGQIATRIGSVLKISGSRVQTLAANAGKVREAVALAAKAQPGELTTEQLQLLKNVAEGWDDDVLATKAENVVLKALKYREAHDLPTATKDAASSGKPAASRGGFNDTDYKVPKNMTLDPNFDVRGVPVAKDGEGNYWVFDPTTGQTIARIERDDVIAHMAGKDASRDSFGRKRTTKVRDRDNLGRRRNEHDG